MSETSHAPRYALYFAPPLDSAWDRFGRHWLGRCAYHGHRVDMTALPDVCHGRQAVFTARPRRYGFHATMKAPFRLAQDQDLDALLAALEVFCRDFAPFVLPRLRPVHGTRGYLSLAPEKSEPRLDHLAAHCVTRFDSFRAPLNEAELAHRHAEPLSRRQNANLERWGYPHVMEDFRFHFSLTDRLERSEAGLLAHLKDALMQLMPQEPLAFDALSVFEEPSPGADFRLIRRVPLAARSRRTYVPRRPAPGDRVAWVATWMPRTQLP